MGSVHEKHFFLNTPESPGQLQYILTESPALTWEEVTPSPRLSLLLQQVGVGEWAQWGPWLDALIVTARAAASPQHDGTRHPPSGPT